LLAWPRRHVNLEVLAHNKPYQLMRDFIAVAMCCSTDGCPGRDPKVPAKTVAG